MKTLKRNKNQIQIHIKFYLSKIPLDELSLAKQAVVDLKFLIFILFYSFH